MNAIENIVRFLVVQSLLAAALAAVVWGVLSLTRLRSARWRYTLWLLVLIRSLVPGMPLITVPHPSEALTGLGITTAQALGPIGTAGEAVSSPQLQTAARRPFHASRVRLALGNWDSGLFVVWLGGVLGVGGGILFRAWGVMRFLKRHRGEPDLCMECEFLEMLQVLGLKRRPPLRMLQGVRQPFVWGGLGGTIYLPKDFARQGSRRQRQLVIAHELAHVLRGDVWANLMQVFVQVLFWFHPVVWWINRAIRVEREKCCDELAIAALSASPREYSTAILDRLAEHWELGRPNSSLAISGGAKDLEQRLHSILAPGKRFRFHCPLWWKASVAGIGMVMLLPGMRDAAPSSVASDNLSSRGAFHILSLSGLGLKPLSTSWTSGTLDNSLSALKPGARVFEGVPFRIAGVLALRSTQKDAVAFPAGTGPLPVGRRCDRVYLLGGAVGRAREGERVATLTFSYEDGTYEGVSLRYGVQVRNWWFWDFEAVRDPLSRTFWTGSNPAVSEAGGALRLYEVILKNPNPGRTVTDIELTSDVSKAAPMLLAITLHEKKKRL